MAKPKVSVVVITYNQEKYVEEALKSFVMQDADFRFEVIVADDKSTDKTQSIIGKYAKEYPDIIKPILRKENLGPQKNFLDALHASRGEYIALCEGDDFWTDPAKLQKQAKFLDDNPGYALCFHPVRVFFEDKSKPDYTFPDPKQHAEFTTFELLKGNFIQTNSVMYRRQDYTKLPDDVLPFDWFLHLYHARAGKIGFLDESMSAYRRHSEGIWWDTSKNLDNVWKRHGVAYLAMYMRLLELFGGKRQYRAIIEQYITDYFSTIARIDDQNGEENLLNTIIKNPVASEKFLRRLQGDFKKLAAKNAELQAALTARDESLQHAEAKLREIRSSKLWKSRNKLARYIGKDVV